MKFLILLALAALPAQAAVFDASDILPEKSAAISGFGELLLSDPSSEGIEGRARFGLSDAWNATGIIGTGSKNKGFRLGGELIYNMIPDWEGQFGISGMASATYINRGTGGVLFRFAPMVHKRFTGWNALPALVYASLPFSLEARSGTYTSGSQFVVGSLFDISEAKRFYVGGEGGIRLAKAESYVLLGFGIRLGEMRFDRKERSGQDAEHKERTTGQDPERKERKTGKGEKEYSDEDFK
jgi:hypothetical protein